MDQLYRKAMERDNENPEITLRDYDEMGRLENILANFVQEQIAELPNPELGKCLLKLMVTAEGTKKSVTAEL